MPVPDGVFSMLQNGGLYAMFMFMFVVLVFAPLIYVAVLSRGPSHNRLVEVIDAFSRFVTALKKPKTRRRQPRD